MNPPQAHDCMPVSPCPFRWPHPLSREFTAFHFLPMPLSCLARSVAGAPMTADTKNGGSRDELSVLFDGRSRADPCSTPASARQLRQPRGGHRMESDLAGQYSLERGPTYPSLLRHDAYCDVRCSELDRGSL